MARKIYTSQRRYMNQNPAITFRMKKEEKEKIVSMARIAGKSVSELVRVALLDLEEVFSESYEEASSIGHRIGSTNAKNKYRIWFYCNVCAGVIDILPNSDIHKVIID